MREWTCQDVRAAFSRHLDGRDSREHAAAVTAHCTACQDCGRALEGYKALFGQLATLKTAPARPLPQWPALDSLPPRPLLPRGAFWNSWRSAVAAAVLLVAVGVGREFIDPRPEIANQNRPNVPSLTVGNPADSSDRSLWMVAHSPSTDPVVEARRALHRHADRTSLALRFLALLPETSAELGQDLLDKLLDDLARSKEFDDLQGAIDYLCPADRAWARQYLDAVVVFLDRAGSTRASGCGDAPVEWLREAAVRTDLPMLASYLRAQLGEGLGPIGDMDFSCAEKPLSQASRRASTNFAERFLAAQCDLVHGRPIAAARGLRGLRGTQRTEVALLPISKVFEAEAWRRAGLEFEAQRALREAGTILLRGSPATVALASRDGLIGPKLVGISMPLRAPVVSESEAVLPVQLPSGPSAGRSGFEPMPFPVSVPVQFAR